MENRSKEEMTLNKRIALFFLILAFFWAAFPAVYMGMKYMWGPIIADIQEAAAEAWDNTSDQESQGR